MINEILYIIVGFITGFCLSSIYWTKPIQDKKDNKLRNEIKAIRKKIEELNNLGGTTNER